MPNQLANESSPYLLQHANNPVDWHPWSQEVLARARAESKPILLSIGYAACHWCHVMEHESFEDETTAKLMNERFINIKVDREERPDLDSIYMQAVQAMTGHGGWPMTVFLTPDGVPFYGGTYYPPQDRHGMPSFRKVLLAVSDAYHNRPADIGRTVEEMRRLYASTTEAARSTGALSPQTLERAYRGLAQRFDMRDAGFDHAPKFPQAMALDFLLRYWRRTGAELALEIAHRSFITMARGGIYDQVGGGFARYSVDAVWLVPHFEKMLYDNALLARLGIHLWQATRDEEARRVTVETLDWVLREMTSPSGGFFSTLDADSEGEEGKFYVWSEAELRELLGADAEVAVSYWGVTRGGNFEGHNILHVSAPPAVAAVRAGVDETQLAATIQRARKTLYDARAKRIWPGLDDKILAGWNGLMLRAMAEGARVLEREDYRSAAVANGEFLFREMVREGRVMRTHRNGVTKLAGYLEDHAAVGLGALALYELTFDEQWVQRARTVAEAMVSAFYDAEARIFFDTANDHESLVTRPRDITDNAVPSGTSLAVELLLRISELTQDVSMRRLADWVLESLAEPMARHGIAFGHLLGAADLAVHGAVEVALVGDAASDDFKALAREVASHYVPSLVLAGGQAAETGEVALLRDRPQVDGKATAYVCRQYTCDSPVTDPVALSPQLEGAVVARSP